MEGLGQENCWKKLQEEEGTQQTNWENVDQKIKNKIKNKVSHKSDIKSPKRFKKKSQS